MSGSLSGSPITFTATGTAGAATQLAITNQPVGGASGAAFATQPLVVIRDAYGNTVTTDSSTVVWGGLGMDAQHAYMQALHQGTQPVPVDYIASCTPRLGDADTHAVMLANCFAQSAQLMRGMTPEERETFKRKMKDKWCSPSQARSEQE
jgi:hypothetical protein